jgi:hypothetical protein
MDVWAVGLVAMELCDSADPTFGRAVRNSDLRSMMCALLGTPTRDNGMMPSYFAHRGDSPTGTADSFDVVPSRVRTRNNRDWTDRVLETVLVMEPTRRASALECVGATAPVGQRSRTPSCPKTPRLSAVRLSGPRVCTDPMRAEAGEVLFETCMRRALGSDRRAFHSAVRLFDRVCDARDADCGRNGRMSHRDMGLLCAACSTIASKLCDGEGISSTWPANLRMHAHRMGTEARGTGRFDLSPAAVDAEELRVLGETEWDVWDVLVIDVSGGAGSEVYDFVVDTLVSRMRIGDMIPTEMAEIGAFIAAALSNPRSPSPAFPSDSADVLSAAVDAFNVDSGVATPIKRKHMARCGALVFSRARVDFETIRWI